MKKLLLILSVFVFPQSTWAQLNEGLYCTVLDFNSGEGYIFEWRLTRIPGVGANPGVYLLIGRETTSDRQVDGTITARFGFGRVGFTLYPKGGAVPEIGNANVLFEDGQLFTGPGIIYFVNDDDFVEYDMSWVNPVPSGFVCPKYEDL